MATAVRDELIRLLKDDAEVRQLVQGELRNEIRALAIEVHKLAESQNRTEQELRKLGEAQQRTEQEVRMLGESQQRLAQAQQQTERAVQMLARQVGGLSDKIGGSLEDLAIQTLPYVLAEAWKLTDVECDRETVTVSGGTFELDLVLRASLPSGKPLVVVGEVKARLTGGEVESFLATVKEIASGFAPAEVRPAFFGFQCNADARVRIQRAGAAMVFSTGRLLPAA